MLRRLYLQCKKLETATATWLQAWGLVGLHKNPPHIGCIPTKLSYQNYARDMAYIVPPGQAETSRNLMHRVYDTLLQMTAAETPTGRVIRIVQKTVHKLDPGVAEPTCHVCLVGGPIRLVIHHS